MEEVKEMKTDQLCHWLKSKLDDEEDWNEATLIIQQHKIKGKNFLNYTLEQWVKVVGLPAGIADSLVQIANGVLESGAAAVNAEESGPVGVNRKRQTAEISALELRGEKTRIDAYEKSNLNIKEPGIGDHLHNLLTALQVELQLKLPIRPIQKIGDNLLSDSLIGTPQRVFVNREAEIELVLKTFHDSRNSLDKVSLLVCSQMFGQGKTRFGRELTNPHLYLKFSNYPEITQYQPIIDRLCAAEYVRIDVSVIIRYVKPEDFGMHFWIRICIICSILELRGVAMEKLARFCKRNIKNVPDVGIYLIEALNQNVFFHFDEIDALVSFTNNDDERVARFYDFWLELSPFLKDKKLIFCSARQAWFQKGKGPYQPPSGLARIVLRALSKSYIKELISRSPAEDRFLRSEQKTVLDQLELYDDDVLWAVSEQIERVTGGIPRLIDYSIHSLCISSKEERITMKSIPILFGKVSTLQKTLRNSVDVKIMLEQLESKNNHPFFALLIWLGYTEIAVDLTLIVNFFGRIKLSISELADFCCIYLASTDGSNVLIKLPQCFRDVIEDERDSPLGEAFPLVKTGSQWKTFENLVQCFLWSLMKMSQISSQNITLGVVCPALQPTHAGELHFDSNSTRNHVIQHIGKITKKNAKSRFTDMMKRIQKGDRVIVSFFEKSHSPDHLLIFNLDVLILVGIQDKLYRSKNWATEKLLKEEIEKFNVCCTHCKAKRSVFVLLAPFLDGDLKEQDGQVLTAANYCFIPIDMHVIVLSLKTGAASFLFSESFVFELISYQSLF